VRRNLEELLQQQIDELWSDPRRRRVGDERACDVDADRVIKIGDDAVDEVDQSRVVTQRGGRRLEHQPGDPIRMIECDPPRNETRAEWPARTARSILQASSSGTTSAAKSSTR
jgi:hypothetical protein